MKLKIFIVIISFFFLGCVTMPPAALDMHNVLVDETYRMHNLNIELVNAYFTQRAREIDEFIENVYTYNLIKNVQKGLANLDYDQDSLFVLTYPKIQHNIIAKRDTLQLQLQEERLRVITDLNENFNAYEIYSKELGQLINSTIKIEEEREDFVRRIDAITKDKLKLAEMEAKADKILIEAGKVSKTVDDSSETIEDVIDNAKKILNKE